MSTTVVDIVIDPVYFDPSSTLRGVVDFLTVCPTAPQGVAVIGADRRFATVVKRLTDSGGVSQTQHKVPDLVGPRASLHDLLCEGLAARLGVSP